MIPEMLSHIFASAAPAMTAIKPHGAILAPSTAPTDVASNGSTVSTFVSVAADIGLVVLLGGILMCLYRIMRGPHLADRVLAADTLSLQVVGLVILLTVRLGSTAFLDVALVVAIIGFATTLAFAQYIGAHAQARRERE